jgi:hypothetical protein
MKLAVLIAAPLIALATAAWADEVIVTHTDQPPAAEQAAAAASDQDRQKSANGDWARRVLAGQPGDRPAGDAPAKGCQRNPDRAPHGEVWVGAGSGGYNTVGAVVTQPIGDCAQATVAISRTEGGNIRRGRR